MYSITSNQQIGKNISLPMALFCIHPFDAYGVINQKVKGRGAYLMFLLLGNECTNRGKLPVF
jgi:hypothetical protein